MKKISILASLLTGSYMLVSFAAHSQSFEASDKPKGATSSIENKATERGEITPAGSSLPENSNAVKTFKSLFGDVPSVIWTKIDRKHDRAYFVNDGITVRAGFNQKGKLMYTFRYYTEEHLPKDILLRIMQSYPCRNIFGIVEVNVAGKTAYLVDLEDKRSWLKIKVLEDEITEQSLMLKR